MLARRKQAWCSSTRYGSDSKTKLRGWWQASCTGTNTLAPTHLAQAARRLAWERRAGGQRPAWQREAGLQLQDARSKGSTAVSLGSSIRGEISEDGSIKRPTRLVVGNLGSGIHSGTHGVSGPLVRGLEMPGCNPCPAHDQMHLDCSLGRPRMPEVRGPTRAFVLGSASLPPPYLCENYTAGIKSRLVLILCCGG